LWGWRFSLAFACLFAALFFAGTVIAPDSPNSLLLNGKTEEATQVITPVAPHGHPPKLNALHALTLQCTAGAVLVLHLSQHESHCVTMTVTGCLGLMQSMLSRCNKRHIHHKIWRRDLPGWLITQP
jgi:hypothetical protein